MPAQNQNKKPSVHLWEHVKAPQQPEQSKPSSPKGSTGVFSFFSRRPKSPTGVRSPGRARSPDQSASGSSSPMSVRTANRGVAKISSSIEPEASASDFEMGKVIMSLDKAVKLVVDVNAEIKVLEKMDITEAEGVAGERKCRKQARKAEQLVQMLNSVYVLDITERRTFQPLYDRVMAELVPFLEISTAMESSKDGRGRRGSLIRAAEKQREMLDQVAQKLGALEPPNSQPSSSSSLSQAPSSKSLEDEDSPEKDDEDRSAAGTVGPLSAPAQRNPASSVGGQAWGLRNSASSFGGSNVGEPEAINTLLPRNNSAASLFDDAASVSGSTRWGMPVLPRSNTAASLFDDAGSVRGSEAYTLPRGTSNKSLLEGLLEHQSAAVSSGASQKCNSLPLLPRNNSAVSLLNAYMAELGEGSSLGDDSDAGSESSRSRPVSTTSSASLFDALLAVQHPGSSSGSVMPRSTSMTSTLSYFSNGNLSGMQIPEQQVAVV